MTKSSNISNIDRGLHSKLIPPLVRLFLLLPSLLILAGCQFSLPDIFDREEATNTPEAFVATVEIAPTQTASPQPTPIPSPTATRFVTPTAVPGGMVLTISPEKSQAGWWGSNDSRKNHIGDSFLYSGYFDDGAFVSAIQFDLSAILPGRAVNQAFLRLTGLRDDRLSEDADGSWRVQILAPDAIESLVNADFQTLLNARAAITLVPSLRSDELSAETVNTWKLDPSVRSWLARQVEQGTEQITVRIQGPTAGQNGLFGWDSGVGASTMGSSPELLVSLGPPPSTPITLPTEPVKVATFTPTPNNVLTVAANAQTATVIATTVGTFTPSPDRIVTPTPLPEGLTEVQAIALSEGLPPIVNPTPEPANAATATTQVLYATAIALTTGTFTPTPENAVTPIIITPTPIPENVATAAAQSISATALVAEIGTATPMPYNAVIATTTPKPPVLTNTPTPENNATVRAAIAYATAVAITTGTFTPIPPEAVTATPTATPTRLPLVIKKIPTPRTDPTPPPDRLPKSVRGKILFESERPTVQGLPRTGIWAYDPINKRYSYVTQRWVYDLAQRLEQIAERSEGVYRLFVKPDGRRIEEVFVYDSQYNTEYQLTPLTGMSYDAAWSPDGNRVAFVSQEAGNDEIYTVNRDGSNMQRLTFNDWEWDKHPSWSPDGSQIVFHSNRGSGRQQLWIMNADGSNQRLLFSSGSEDTAPIWVK